MTESPPASFATLLRKLRTDAGLTQEKLAEAAKVSYRSISDLERGINRTPRRDTARLLADALGLTGEERAAFEAAARGRWSMPREARTAPQPGAMAAATRTLPRDITSFTGRRPEIDSLLETVTDTANTGSVVDICAIGGMAGVGKTALAVHVAHRLAGRFPDGQLFLQLHGHTPGQQPVGPADALASLLQACGIPAPRIPDGLEPRAWLWRDHLADKRLLLLLDDAAGHEQVRPLLPGSPGTLVLVTSRRHLTALEDTRVISLDTLPPHDAAVLLVRLAARPGLDPHDNAVRDIARLCGYLPLAVGMLARQLHHHPTWTVAGLAADLATARDRLELMRAENLSVAAAFDLSYRELPPEEQRLFRYLGLHPGTDFDDYAAAAVGDSDLAATRRQLSDLYDHYLLAEPAHAHYRMHDLIAEYARALASEEPTDEQEAAVDRLLGYYLHTTRIAGRQFHRRTPAGPPVIAGDPPAHSPEFAAQAVATAWMDAEHVNLRAATVYAASHGKAGYAIEIPAAMHGYLRHRGNGQQVLALHQIALDLARQLGDAQAEANALTDIGDIQQLAGDLPSAASSLTRAIELHRSHGNTLGMAHALSIIGYVQHLSGDNHAANASLTQALGRHRALGDRLGQAGSLVYLGLLHVATGDYSAAEADLAQALQVYQGLGGVMEGGLLDILGAVQEAVGDYSAATATLTRALELHRGLGNPHGEVDALRHLAFAQQVLGDFDAAATSLHQALQLSRSFGIHRGEARSLHYLGQTQFQTGEYAKAAASLAQALELYGGVRLGEAQVLNALGELLLVSNGPDHAYTRHKQALDIASDVGLPLEEAHALEGMGRCLRQKGQPKEAIAHLHQALAIYERIGSPRAQGVRDTLRGLSQPEV